MSPTGEDDLRSDSGYRRLSGDDEDEATGHGIRGANLLRRGNTPAGQLELFSGSTGSSPQPGGLLSRVRHSA
eukprot:3200319-Pyramimonas_sp.AAC.1